MTTSRSRQVASLRRTASALEAKAKAAPARGKELRADATKLLKGARLLESFQTNPSETDGSRPSSPAPSESPTASERSEDPTSD